MGVCAWKIQPEEINCHIEVSDSLYVKCVGETFVAFSNFIKVIRKLSSCFGEISLSSRGVVKSS